MDIKSVLSKNLGITKLTPASLKEALAHHYNHLPDDEKRRINREIAHYVIKAMGLPQDKKRYEATAKTGSLSDTRVLGINYFGPLDVTIQWKTETDGTLTLAGYRTDSGGDQINVSKVFSAFHENIALVAWTGKAGGEITDVWERNFLNSRIIPTLIRDTEEDERAAIYNIIDGDTLPGMFGWANELSGETVENINQEALTMLNRMLKGGSDNIWMTLSAGGPIRYNRRLAYYASLIKEVKKKYRDDVKLLIDFKFMSGPAETMSVLDIHRETPQDIIKPNLEEFIQILTLSGLAEKGALDKNAITEKVVKAYAIKLRNKYNLLGVLVSMDKSGLVLVMKDRIIKEKGISIIQACPTGAGDSLKAGLLYALSNGKSFEEAVHTGNLFGASTASMEGSQTVTPDSLAKIETLARIQNVVPEIEMPMSLGTGISSEQ
ncbi:MAG: PfkB family carbohydrate kinase [Candidatus Omnitrophica bacterium]|nr:PfkB family carbohydrate kinase [Candidatus Omnitrophota bacterium]